MAQVFELLSHTQETQMELLALVCNSLGHCGHVESGPADERSLYLSFTFSVLSNTYLRTYINLKELS